MLVLYATEPHNSNLLEAQNYPVYCPVQMVVSNSIGCLYPTIKQKMGFWGPRGSNGCTRAECYACLAARLWSGPIFNVEIVWMVLCHVEYSKICLTLVFEHLDQGPGLKLSFIRGPHFTQKRSRGPHKEKKCLRGPQYEAKSAFILQKTVVSAIGTGTQLMPSVVFPLKYWRLCLVCLFKKKFVVVLSATAYNELEVANLQTAVDTCQCL